MITGIQQRPRHNWPNNVTHAGERHVDAINQSLLGCTCLGQQRGNRRANQVIRREHNQRCNDYF